jgi:hypothetical protein
MYSTIEEAWGEQPILTIPNHEILYNKNKCNDNTNTNTNADTNADTSVNTNANTNTNTNTNSIAKTIDNTILNKSKELSEKRGGEPNDPILKNYLSSYERDKGVKHSSEVKKEKIKKANKKLKKFGVSISD